MNGGRYALLGLGRARSSCLGKLSAWTTSGTIPAELSKCVSIAEVRQRLAGLQPYSALIVEAGAVGIDRDMFDLARRRGVIPLVVDPGSTKVDEWQALGAAAVITTQLTPATLLQALMTYCATVGNDQAGVHDSPIEQLSGWSGNLVAVCGPGGSGASTIAIALAQEFARSALDSTLILLADLARNGEQAMLHDAGDVIPGIEDVVEAHRHRNPSTDEIQSMTFGVPVRNYQLLLGTRRSSAWSAMPPRAVDASLQSLRKSFHTVVTDITADFESEREGGSRDVEDRNALALYSLRHAAAVVVVGSCGLKGAYSLSRLIRDLLGAGVEPTAIVPVMNMAPKGRGRRNELTKALQGLLASRHEFVPTFVGTHNVDADLRDGVALNKSLGTEVMLSVQAVLSERSPVTSQSEAPTPIEPGSLGFAQEAMGY